VYGQVKSYSNTKGGVGISPTTGLPTWFSPEVQVCVSVRGSGTEGLVSVVYDKTGLGLGMSGTNTGVKYIGLESIANSTILRDLPAPLVIFGDQNRFTSRQLMRRHANLLKTISNNGDN
jgi:hypothetical protein